MLNSHLMDRNILIFSGQYIPTSWLWVLFPVQKYLYVLIFPFDTQRTQMLSRWKNFITLQITSFVCQRQAYRIVWVNLCTSLQPINEHHSTPEHRWKNIGWYGNRTLCNFSSLISVLTKFINYIYCKRSYFCWK